MKYSLWFFCLLWFIPDPAFSQATRNLDDFVNDKRLAAASVGFCMVDVKTGEIILEHRSAKAMTPASLLKIPTTLAALDVLGPDFQFQTSLYGLGAVEQGILRGDLCLVGGGDPSLGSSFAGKKPDEILAEFVNAVKGKQIKSITGDFLLEERAVSNLIPSTWSWEDIANYYAAPARALNYRDNRMEITFKTGAPGTKAVLLSSSPEIAGMQIVSEVLAASISADEAYCFAAPDELNMVVRGSLPANKDRFTIKAAMPQPGLQFARELVAAMQKQGIALNGIIRLLKADEQMDLSPKNLLHRELSPALSEIVVITNKNSNNLFAEAMAKQVALKRGGAEAEISEAMMQFWKDKLSTTGGLNIKDGSGLSAYNTISPLQLCEMLVAGSRSNFAPVFRKSLPKAGESGTLKNFGAGTVLQNNLVAKSGYMTGSRGYAGYMRLKSGREVAFSLMVNNYDLPPAEMRKMMEGLLSKISGDDKL